MATTTKKLTQSRLKDLLHYDPETGDFTWLCTRKGVRRSKRAGGVNKHGYILIRIDGSQYKAHRLAWLYVHGRWPVDEIDHINHQPGDNRLRNLREASHQDNHKNRSVPGDSSTGVVGVYFRPDAGKFRAHIRHNDKQHNLGYFKTLEEAIEARKKAEAAFNFHPNHGGGK